MHTTVIGGKVQAVMSERDIRIMWAALKAYEEFGLPPGCVGYLDEGELESLLDTVTKTCNQPFHKTAMSDAEAKDRSERQKHYGIVHNMKRAKRLAAEARWAKLEHEAWRRRTYEYGLSYDRPETIKKPITIKPKLVKAKKPKKARKTCRPKRKKSTTG